MRALMVTASLGERQPEFTLFYASGTSSIHRFHCVIPAPIPIFGAQGQAAGRASAAAVLNR
jgi:hypothetical protein